MRGAAFWPSPGPVIRLQPRHDLIDQAVEPRGPLLAFGADVEVLGHGPQLGDGELAQHELGELVEAGTVGSAHRCSPRSGRLCVWARKDPGERRFRWYLLGLPRNAILLSGNWISTTSTVRRERQHWREEGKVPSEPALALGRLRRNVSKPAVARVFSTSR